MMLATGATKCSFWRRSLSRFPRTNVFMLIPFVSFGTDSRRAQVWLVGVDLNLLRLCFLHLRQRHGQDSIPISRAHFIGVDTGRQRDAAAELTDITLGAFSLLAVGTFALAFAADCQRSVVQGDFDVLLAHTGQFNQGDNIVVILIKIERRRPPTEKLPLASEIGPGWQLESVLEIIPQVAPAIEGRPCRQFRDLITN